MINVTLNNFSRRRLKEKNGTATGKTPIRDKNFTFPITNKCLIHNKIKVFSIIYYVIIILQYYNIIICNDNITNINTKENQPVYLLMTI